jgi:hypothetical protein
VIDLTHSLDETLKQIAGIRKVVRLSSWNLQFAKNPSQTDSLSCVSQVSLIDPAARSLATHAAAHCIKVVESYPFLPAL